MAIAPKLVPRAAIIIFRGPAESGGEWSMTAFPIASNRVCASRGTNENKHSPAMEVFTR